MRSGMIEWRAPCSEATPSITSRSVPMPVMRAPIATRQSARSEISGSRATLASTVWPSARLAAMSRFSVAPTEANGRTITAPRSLPFTSAWM